MSSVTSNASHPHKSLTVVLWVLPVLVGMAFLAAGGARLAGAPPMVAMFDTIGVGQWFRVVIGLLEVTGAIGLFVPRATMYAAVVLMMVMFGAVVAHMTVLGGNPAPPIMLLILSSTIAWLTRESQ